MPSRGVGLGCCGAYSPSGSFLLSDFLRHLALQRSTLLLSSPPWAPGSFPHWLRRLPHLLPSVPCRMGFLSFPWAFVSLHGVGQDIGSLGQLNAKGLWFHPGKGEACMGHQDLELPGVTSAPPPGGADMDDATDHLLQPWLGAHYQPQPQRGQGQLLWPATHEQVNP